MFTMLPLLNENDENEEISSAPDIKYQCDHKNFNCIVHTLIWCSLFTRLHISIKIKFTLQLHFLFVKYSYGFGAQIRPKPLALLSCSWLMENMLKPIPIRDKSTADLKTNPESEFLIADVSDSWAIFMKLIPCRENCRDSVIVAWLMVRS